MKGKIICAVAMALTLTHALQAQQSRWALSTNLPTWALLGTINAGCHFAIDSNWSFEASIKYNPVSYSNVGRDSFRLKQATPSIGLRYWGRECWDGWFLEAKVLGSVYNVANIFGSGCFEGELIGAGITAGYNIPLDEKLQIGLGLGAALARHHTTYYLGPVCGRKLSSVRGWAVFPCDLTVSLFYIL